MGQTKLTIYIDEKQKQWLTNHPRSDGSLSSIIRSILNEQMGEQKENAIQIHNN